jgi:ketosteroid isomerase-like protein
MINEIQEIIDRETKAWDKQDINLLLSIFHHDMVWVWPPTSDDHDPMKWEMVLGKFNPERWTSFYQDFFREHTLVHNARETKRIVISKQGDAAFAVVDINTLWVNRQGQESHWLGRVCKVYAKVNEGWKLTMHTGVLIY